MTPRPLDHFDLDSASPRKAARGGPFEIVAVRNRALLAAGRAVLVVDGDEAYAERTAATLREAGYHVAVETTPRAAARHMSHLGAPGLVLLEVEHPQMNGFDFLERLRGNRHLKDTPVILLTSRCARRDLVRGLQAGADGYVTKSVDATTLLAAVARLLPLPPATAPD